jgi:hypothetical protein
MGVDHSRSEDLESLCYIIVSGASKLFEGIVDGIFSRDIALFCGYPRWHIECCSWCRHFNAGDSSPDGNGEYPCYECLKNAISHSYQCCGIFFANAVIWPQVCLMIVGAIIGGYGGAYFARKIEQEWIRYLVISAGLAMTIYFFIHS